LISAHATHGTSSTATFSLVVTVGGRRGVALVDSGSIDSFMDYTFASHISCPIFTTISKFIKIVGGGSLTSDAITGVIPYTVQKEEFSNGFKLLQLKGYEMILGCDWIKTHSPIGLDLRDSSRQLIIQKNGKQ
jgi:hypothetical protein